MNTKLELIKVATHYRQANMLFSAIELDIFSIIDDNHMVVEAIAEASNANKDNLKLLLDGLVDMEILSKCNSKYSNVEKYKQFLKASSRQFIGKEIIYHKEQNALWLKLSEKIIGENKDNSKSKEDEVFNSNKIDGYLRIVQETNEHFATKLVSWFADKIPNKGKVLDLGGGHGFHSEQLLAKREDITVTLVDLESAVNFCKKNNIKLVNNKRFKIQTGNALSLNLAEKYDVIMINDLLASFNYVDKVKILHNAKEHLKPGGYIIVSKFSRKDDNDDSHKNALFSLKILINTQDGYLESDNDLVDMFNGIELKEIVSHVIGRKTIVVGVNYESS